MKYESEYHILSIQQGLIPPEDQALKLCSCGHYHVKETASTVELYLANRQHRWKEMRIVQKDFFMGMAKEVTQYEKDMLALLKLPDIETVRRSIVDNNIERTGKFNYTESMQAGVKRIFKEWEQTFIGGIELKQTEEERTSLLKWFVQLAYIIGFNETRKLIARILPLGLPENYLDNFIANMNNPYFINMLLAGATRIKTKIALDNLRLVQKTLLAMAADGSYPLDVGRFLHKKIGEGDLWYWMRIARSEAVLAANAAYNQMVKEVGTRYEKWSAAAGACPVCGNLNGQVWRTGDGPEPVSDTHPHSVERWCKIYTIDGWKEIHAIKIGDLVLTHKGRFMPVTKLHKHTEYNQDMLEIGYKNKDYQKGKQSYTTLKLSDNHPISINGEWKPVREIKSGDIIRVLATRCKTCDELIPYSRWRNMTGQESDYCCQSCNTKATVKKFGGDYLTAAFHKNTRELFKQGKHHFQLDKKLQSKCNSGNSRIKYNTKAEQILKKAMNDSGINFIHQFMIKRPELRGCSINGKMNRFYKIDFVIPDLNIAIECNGKYWHKKTDYQEIRKQFIKDNGFTLIEFKNEEIFNNTDRCIDKINRMMKNHSGKYEFKNIPIEIIKRYNAKKITLYNLSVREDESYIAKGFVVHNCLCVRIPLFEWRGVTQPKYDKEENNPYKP